jgi:hypothetical protein
LRQPNIVLLLFTSAPGNSNRLKKKVKTEAAELPIAAKEWPEIDKKRITDVTREILARLVSSDRLPLLRSRDASGLVFSLRGVLLITADSR